MASARYSCKDLLERISTGSPQDLLLIKYLYRIVQSIFKILTQGFGGRIWTGSPQDLLRRTGTSHKRTPRGFYFKIFSQWPVQVRISPGSPQDLRIRTCTGSCMWRIREDFNASGSPQDLLTRICTRSCKDLLERTSPGSPQDLLRRTCTISHLQRSCARSCKDLLESSPQGSPQDLATRACTRSHFIVARFVRACAVDMPLDMSQDPF